MLHPELSIETITPEKAERYLARNFSDNRKSTDATIMRYANQMKNNEWYLSTDAIAITEEGELVNGQHRLQAVVKSGVAVDFVIFKNYPRKNVRCLDIGKKRMMHERITIEGVPMSVNECSIIRNCFTSYKSGGLGSQLFSDLRHDTFVVTEFKKHNLFLRLLSDLGYARHGVPNFFSVAALFILLDIDHKINKYKDTRYDYIGEQYSFPALTRALQFLELCTTGNLEHTGIYKGSRDGAAKALYDSHQKRKHEGKYWAAFDQLNLTLSAASNFAQERRVSVLNKTKSLPFQPLNTYRASNDILSTTISANEPYLTDKQLEILYGIILVDL